MPFGYLHLCFKYILPIGTAVIAALYYHRMAEDPDKLDGGQSGILKNDKSGHSEDLLNGILLDLMKKAESRVKEIDDIVSFVHRKAETYRTERKFDAIDVVGSIGNKLYFPEQLPDGSYQLEMDVLFSRKLPNVPLPVSVGDKDKIPVAHIRQHTKLLSNEGDIAGPKSYMCLLQVENIDGDMEEFDRNTFLETKPDGKTYLKSTAYKSSIPYSFERSILGEREIQTVGPPLLLPLYRTFKTSELRLELNSKTYRFSILMDKVAALKTPWPSEAIEFQTRDRKWPSKGIVGSIIEDGCLLIHKPSNTETSGLEWKVTFSLSEQKTTQHFSFYQRFMFIIFKLIKRKYLDLGTLQSGESRSGLTTYHMKTIYLWMCESLDQTIWSESPSTPFITFFQKLKECIETAECPHYFMPEVNVMSDIWKHKRLDLDESRDLEENPPVHTLTQTIDRILEKPEEYLTEELFNVVDEKHVLERQKEIVPTDPMLDILDSALHQIADRNVSSSAAMAFLKGMAENLTGKDND